MTTDVVTAAADASVAEIATVLAGRGISAVPIVNRFDVVIGVVSRTDLREKIDIGEPDGEARGGWLRRWSQPQLLWSRATATEVMSAPSITIHPAASVPAAGRVMHDRGVERLLVVDGSRRLVGIVTRSDLLKIHDRPDAVIRDDVQRVLRRTLMLTPDTVRAAIDDGVVTLTGHTGLKSTALAAAALAETVPGVDDVIDLLTSATDDTSAASASTPAPHPPPDSWIGRPLGRPTTRHDAWDRGSSATELLSTTAGSGAPR